MKAIALVALLALIALFVSAAHAAETKTKDCSNCQANEYCCPDLFYGNTCYNPDTHSCASIIGTAQVRLCRKDEHACSDGIDGKICFDPTKFDCVAVEGYNTVYRRICPTGHKACGASNTCYDPAQNSCCDGSIC